MPTFIVCVMFPS